MQWKMLTFQGKKTYTMHIKANLLKDGDAKPWV